MKNKLFMVCLAATFVACTNYEEKAQVYLQRANDLMKQEAYSEAKLQIDSIRKLYPKAVEARKEGIRIVQQIELKEQNRTLAYLDSVYQAKMAQLDSMKGNYVFEKNAEYQEEGNYFSPSQTVEKNINRTFLRAQVSEKGVMNLTSIWKEQYSSHDGKGKLGQYVCADTLVEGCIRNFRFGMENRKSRFCVRSGQ